MCLFPKPVQPNTALYKRGISEIVCGCCPECLSRRSRYWALRASMEARVSPGYMVTLTYDNYLRDKRGAIIGEMPPDATLHVNKRDVQLFFKRLRRHFPGCTIKYIVTAEYGSHTHRAHYHALIFGIVLDDLIVKGRSKRGNTIYRSPTLSRIWANASADADWRTLPIVTVDATLVGPQVARYCTKYCSKDSGRDGGDDTFMLFSHGIGETELMRLFNGRSYMIDGREYPVPRTVWQRVIGDRYGVDFRYKTPQDDPLVSVYRDPVNGRFTPTVDTPLFAYRRARARARRDADPQYKGYLSYWKARSTEFELSRPSPFERIRALPDEKYFVYKAACLKYLCGDTRKAPPRSSALRIAHAEYKLAYGSAYALPPEALAPICRSACHKTANDTDARCGSEMITFSASKQDDEALFFEGCPFDLANSSPVTLKKGVTL